MPRMDQEGPVRLWKKIRSAVGGDTGLNTSQGAALVQRALYALGGSRKEQDSGKAQDKVVKLLSSRLPCRRLSGMSADYIYTELPREELKTWMETGRWSPNFNPTESFRMYEYYDDEEELDEVEDYNENDLFERVSYGEDPTEAILEIFGRPKRKLTPKQQAALKKARMARWKGRAKTAAKIAGGVAAAYGAYRLGKHAGAKFGGSEIGKHLTGEFARQAAKAPRSGLRGKLYAAKKVGQQISMAAREHAREVGSKAGEEIGKRMAARKIWKGMKK